MRIAIVDESATSATIIEEGLVQIPDCEIFVLTERRGLLARISASAAGRRASSTGARKASTFSTPRRQICAVASTITPTPRT